MILLPYLRTGDRAIVAMGSESEIKNVKGGVVYEKVCYGS